MLHRHFADVAAAGVLPVVVYNNPLYTGNNLSPQLIASLMELPNVIGLKQSNDDLGQLVEALRLSADSGRSLCTGIDSQFYAALCVGARGIFSTAAAIVPSQMVRLYDLAQAGDHEAARAQHELLQPLNRFLEYDPGYVSPTKEALELMGIGCGPVRRPLPDFPDEERGALREALAALGGRSRRVPCVRFVTYAADGGAAASAPSTATGSSIAASTATWSRSSPAATLPRQPPSAPAPRATDGSPSRSRA